MKDDRLYLTHIAECIRRIKEYAAPGRDHFMTNTMMQDAVVRNFEIIGEAAKRLSAGALDKVPEIPWRRVAGFRDVLIHDYSGVDYEEVWNIIENELYNLKEAVDYLLK
jgi:uncharacterized protein with HEPN domain